QTVGLLERYFQRAGCFSIFCSFGFSFAETLLPSKAPFSDDLSVFSAHRLCESVIDFDVSLRLTALSLTLSHRERGRVAVASLFAA
ncbi:hypothetical protein, partial [Neisseria meningitidis]|uniref:hypothetical protein n=1 Tax=Neisseria meningitidis TaxID=487 RepID=UPI001E4BEBB9